MKLLSLKKKHKALSAAITLGLMLGVYGYAAAETKTISSGTYGTKGEAVIYNGYDVVNINGDAKFLGNIFANHYKDNAIEGITLNIGGSARIDGYVTSGNSSYNNSKNNIINMTAGSVGGDVEAGFSMSTDSSHEVSGNVANVSGGTVSNRVVGGWSRGNVLVSGNTAVVSAGSVGSFVSGGYTDSGIGKSTLTGNKVFVGKVTGSGSSIALDTSNRGTATLNNNVYGGYINNTSNTSNVSSNEVYINNTVTTNASGTATAGMIKGYVYGGYTSGSGDAQSNKVEIKSGSVTGWVYGGYTAGSGAATSNSVTMSGGSITSRIYGGYSNSGNVGGTSASLGNTVNMSGGSVTASVYGGYTTSGTTASYNKVNISGGTVNRSDGYVIGGYITDSGSSRKDIQNNEVNISGSAQITAVWLLGAMAGDQTGAANQADTNNNKVKISDNAVVNITGRIAGAYNNTGTMSGNAVTIEGSAHVGSNVNSQQKTAIFGAIAAHATVTSNTVNINGDSTTYPTVYADLYGGYNEEDVDTTFFNVTSNQVNITGGSITGTIYGGYNAASGDVSSNSVTMSGGSITGSIYGGWSASGTASGNIVTLGAQNESGYANITGNVYINAGKATSGGTLNVYNYSNTVSQTVSAPGATVNFYLPAANNTNYMLTAGSVDFASASINTSTATSNYTLGSGTEIKLLSLTNTNASINASTYQINGSSVDALTGATITTNNTYSVSAGISTVSNLIIKGAKYTLSSDNKTLSFSTTDSNYYLSQDSVVSGNTTLAYHLYTGSSSTDTSKTLTINEGTSLTLSKGVNSTGAVVNDGTLTLEENGISGTTNTLANVTGTGSLVNNAALNLSGTNTIASLSGTGSTEITAGETTATGSFAQKGLTVDSGKFTIAAHNLQITDATVTNKGTLVLEGTGASNKLAVSVTGDNGNIQIGDDTTAANVEFAADTTITQSGLNVLSGSSLVNNANATFSGNATLEGTITNNNTLNLNGGATVTSSVKNAGTLTLGAASTLANVNSTGTATIVNNAALNLSGTNEIASLSGTSSTEITAGETTAKGSFAQYGLSVDSDATLNIAPGNLQITTNGTTAGNVTNNGTINFNYVSGVTNTVDEAFTGGGTVYFSGGDIVYSNTTANSLDNKVVISSGTTLDPNASVFGEDIENHGTLVLEGTGDSGKLAVSVIGGDGNIQIGFGTTAANVEFAEGKTITQSGLNVLSGSSLVNNATATFSGNATVSGTITNNGTLSLYGAENTISQTLTNTGTVNVKGATSLTSVADGDNTATSTFNVEQDTTTISGTLVQDNLTVGNGATIQVVNKSGKTYDDYKSYDGPTGSTEEKLAESIAAGHIIDSTNTKVMTISNTLTLNNNATLDLSKSNAYETVQTGTLSLPTSGNSGKLEIDSGFYGTTGSYYYRSDQVSVGTSGSGNLSLGVNITSDTSTAETKTSTIFRVVAAEADSGTTDKLSSLTINDSTSVFGSYLYKFKQATAADIAANATVYAASGSGDYKGYVTVTRTAGGNLGEVVRGEQKTVKISETETETVDLGAVDTYSLAGDEYTVNASGALANLGQLKNKTSGSARTLTINGNSYTIHAFTPTSSDTRASGVQVGSGGSLTIKNVTLDGFTNVSGSNGAFVNDAGGTLSLDTVAFSGTVADYDVLNNGTLNMNGTVKLVKGIGGTGDTKIVTGTTTSSGNVTQGTLTVDKGAALELNGTTNSVNTVTNNGTLNLYGSTSNTITGDLANAGTVNVKGKTSLATVSGTGTTKIEGGETTANGSFAQYGLTVDSNAVLNIAAENLKITTDGSTAGTVTNNGTINIKSGSTNTVEEAFTGSGTVKFSGGKFVYSNNTAKSLGNKVVIISGATLDPNASVFGQDIDNSGILILEGDATDANKTGLLSVSVTDSGTVDGVIKIGDGNTADNVEFATGTSITQKEIDILTGNSLTNYGTITSAITSSGTLTSNASNIAGAVTNNGVYNVTGGTISYAIGTSSGSGTLNIKGDTTIANAVATNITSQNITVDSNVTLAVEKLTDEYGKDVKYDGSYDGPTATEDTGKLVQINAGTVINHTNTEYLTTSDSLTLNNGSTLNLARSNAYETVRVGTLTLPASSDASGNAQSATLNIDAGLYGGRTSTIRRYYYRSDQVRVDSLVSAGSGTTGTISLGSVNIIEDTSTAETTVSTVFRVVAGKDDITGTVNDLANLTITGTSSVHDGYVYTFTQVEKLTDITDNEINLASYVASGGGDYHGYMKVERHIGGSLVEVIKAKKLTGSEIEVNLGTVDTYSLAGDENVSPDETGSTAVLGTLTRNQDSTSTARNLTINGNSKTLYAYATISSDTHYGGIVVNSGDSLTLKNITLNGFNKATDTSTSPIASLTGAFVAKTGSTINLENVTFTDTVAEYDVENNGTLNINGKLVLNNGIGGTGTTNINTDLALKTSDKIANSIVVGSGYTLTSALTNLATGTAQKVTNNGTINLQGNLSKDIGGAGTTVLQNDVTMQDGSESSTNRVVSGTLQLSSEADGTKPHTITMADGKYTNLQVGKLTGSGNLTMDVDLSKYGSTTEQYNDKLIITGTGSNATLNLSSIIVRKGSNTLLSDASLTYVETASGGSLDNITFKVNGDVGSMVVRNQFVSATTSAAYNFTQAKDSSDNPIKGKLIITSSNKAVKLKDFVEGTTPTEEDAIDNNLITSYTVDKSYKVTDESPDWSTAAGGEVLASSDGTRTAVTLAVNKKDTDNTDIYLSGNGAVDGITVNNGYTLTVAGESLDSNETQDSLAKISNFRTALTNNGTLNVSNIKFTGNTTDIANNGTAILDNVKAESILNGTSAVLTANNSTIGTLNNSGEAIVDTSTLSTINNSGTVQLTNVTVDNVTNSNYLSLSGVNTIKDTLTNDGWAEFSGSNSFKTIVGSGEIKVLSGSSIATNYFRQRDLKLESGASFVQSGGTFDVDTMSGEGTLNLNGVADAYVRGQAEIANLTGYIGNLSVYALESTVTKLDKVAIGNFNFYIPSTAVDGSTMVNVDQAEVSLSQGAQMVNVNVDLSSSVKLNTGDKINLLKNKYYKVPLEGNPTFGKITNFTAKDIVAEQRFTNYGVHIGIAGVDGGTENALVATITGAQANADAKSPLETMATSMSMLNMGSDMLADAGLESAVNAVQNAEPSKEQSKDPKAAQNAEPSKDQKKDQDKDQKAAQKQNASSEIFAALGGTSARVNSGSHVDLKGMNFNIGYAKAIPNESGKLVIGPVVEYGRGKYDSYLDSGFHGEGNTNYVGAGLVGKQLNNNGVYYEGSIRGGKTMNDYKSVKGEYDTDGLYLAAHFGIGKVFQLKNKDDVDVYGKYFFTHQTGSDAENALDKFDFDNSDSHRARVGFRYNHRYNAANVFYGGLAWQYEFSGETAGSINGMDVEAPSLKGHTGILELGWKVHANKNFDFSMGINGYTGVEHGASANMKLNWKF